MDTLITAKLNLTRAKDAMCKSDSDWVGGHGMFNNFRIALDKAMGDIGDDVDDGYCPMCKRNIWGEYHCFLFGDELETDKENDYSCKRCDKCKQAEVKEQ